MASRMGYQAFFGCGTSKSAGIAILFNNNFDFQISKAYTDPEGRFIICDLITRDDHHLFDFQCEDIILGGDFNLVLSVKKDKKGGMSRTHKKSLEIINNYCESLDLVDVWRVLNPELFKFTWRQRKPEVYCRLDFFLVSQGILCNIIKADIIPGYKTDRFRNFATF